MPNAAVTAVATYEAIPAATYSISGKVTGSDAPAGLTASVQLKNASGNVGVTGTPTYGQTLTANATGTQVGAVLSYEWKAGQTVLQAKGASNTYKVASAAVGKTITVTVTATGYSGSLASNPTTAVAKALLTITGYTPANKNYDGKTDAAVSAVVLSGTQNNDRLTLGTDYTVAASFASKNTGTAIAVGGTVTLSNSLTAQNYSLASGVLSGETASISAINPTYSVAAQNIQSGKTLADIQSTPAATGIHNEPVSGTLTWAQTQGGAALASHTFTGRENAKQTPYWTFAPSGSNHKELSGATVFTINIEVSAIETALAKANAAKADVAVFDLPAANVTNGTKFVTTAEMAALNSAINTATVAKGTVTTAAETAAAAKALAVGCGLF